MLKMHHAAGLLDILTFSKNSKHRIKSDQSNVWFEIIIMQIFCLGALFVKKFAILCSGFML